MLDAIGMLSASDVADVVAHATTRPRPDDLRRIMDLPARQA
ncbi:hypothetical protein AB0L59_25680 [Streptomyces sp. NPDC052109]